MPSPKAIHQRLNQSLEQIMKERFVHSLSHIIYDRISLLWHIDKESEQLMAHIAAKVVAGIFCLEYLSHINSLVKEKAGIKEDITAMDLSNEELIAGIKTRLSRNKEVAGLFKNAAGLLKKFVDAIDIKTLKGLTTIAHTSDYLLSSLQDMKDSRHDEYAIWLSSIPYYYEKDLKYLGLVHYEGLKMRDASLDIDSFAVSFWNEQFSNEPFCLEKIHSNHRINLNAHLPSEAAKEGYFPCTAASAGKNKKIFTPREQSARTRS
ncbi:MAG: hypothetical protein HY266_07740 [Deltaproteobacteria bacterium]|nr:hypothetical protein [Deltaproteobacteria bacterium]